MKIMLKYENNTNNTRVAKDRLYVEKIDFFNVGAAFGRPRLLIQYQLHMLQIFM